jgi:hypothetical protein
MHAETNTHQTFKPEWFSKLNRIQNRFEFPKPSHLGLRPVKPNPVRNSVPNRGIQSGHELLVCNDSDGFPEAIANYAQTNIIKRARRRRAPEPKHLRRAQRSRALVSRKESSTQSSSPYGQIKVSACSVPRTVRSKSVLARSDQSQCLQCSVRWRLQTVRGWFQSVRKKSKVQLFWNLQ